MRDEAAAERVELVSGRGEDETWTKVAAESLPEMFQKQREIFREQLTKRFRLDTSTRCSHSKCIPLSTPPQTRRSWRASRPSAR